MEELNFLVDKPLCVESHTYDENKSTIARLLLKKISMSSIKRWTYFNIKKRELGLPSGKMRLQAYPMVCHEIGHALWTSMNMIKKAEPRGLNASFVNILEDARIEKFEAQVSRSVNQVQKGYAALAARDFFGIAETGVNSCNLIDSSICSSSSDEAEFSDEGFSLTVLIKSKRKTRFLTC